MLLPVSLFLALSPRIWICWNCLVEKGSSPTSAAARLNRSMCAGCGMNETYINKKTMYVYIYYVYDIKGMV